MTKGCRKQLIGACTLCMCTASVDLDIYIYIIFKISMSHDLRVSSLAAIRLECRIESWAKFAKMESNVDII